ncbi:MAG: pentapeptide repeat-containing protein [Bacteriovorax sp.]|jgi:hypothetical protein
METLTLFIDHLFTAELGSSEYQTFEKRTIKSAGYIDVVISGSLFREVVFQDIIFDNCTFFGTSLDNCLFINCLFINCKFQFSSFSDCNFESTSWENCIWGLTALKDSEIIASEGRNNYSFESKGTFTQTLTLTEFLTLSA